MKQRNGRNLRAVIDTNVFVSAILSPLGVPRKLILAWIDDAFTLVLSDEHLREIRDVLARERLIRHFVASDLDRVSLVARLESVPIVHPKISAVPVRDPKDKMILAAALGGGADYVVTGDADLLVLDGDPRLGHLRIVSAGDFLALLSAPSEAESSS